MRLYIAIFFTVFFGIQLKAQEASKESSPASKNGTIENQFDYVFQKSNNYQDYKVVKKEDLNLLNKNSMDSIAKFKTALNELKVKFSTHDAIVTGLNDSLQVVKTELKDLKSAQNNVDFLGTPVSKSSYNLIMWSIVSVLLLIVLISFFQMRSAKSFSKSAHNELVKLEEEFEEYKHKALEKEQKLGRQLQDEINKQNKSKK
jgi:DNA mismatch repair ATPase MutS